MRSLFRTIWMCTLVLALQAQSLNDVLSRMDKAAPLFHALSANVEMVEYNALLSSTTRQTGNLQMQRLKAGNVRAILTFDGGEGDARTIGFLGKKLEVYYPKLNAYQVFEIGKDSGVVNQYLLLGFGSSGTELAQSYNIKFQGPEKVAGRDTSKLELTPKDSAVQQKLQKVLMWVPNDGANPVQQQFYEPSGNYRKLTYTGITVNPQIKGTLDLHLPSGATRQG